jgi:hypothetical protein
VPAEDSKILADALLASALGLGLGHAAQEDQFGAEKKFLKLYTIYLQSVYEVDKPGKFFSRIPSQFSNLYDNWVMKTTWAVWTVC